LKKERRKGEVVEWLLLRCERAEEEDEETKRAETRKTPSSTPTDCEIAAPPYSRKLQWKL
jgi:hypothetical protein